MAGWWGCGRVGPPMRWPRDRAEDGCAGRGRVSKRGTLPKWGGKAAILGVLGE